MRTLYSCGKKLRKLLECGEVEARRLGYSDADLLVSYPSITATDLANAWAYAESHLDEIELAIEQNQVA